MTSTIFEMIDLGSFSSIWYWFVITAAWSSMSHWVFGVPHDLINYARRHGGAAEDDLQAILRVNINRVTLIMNLAGPYILGFAFFVNTLLITLGFYYWMEMAQALAVIIVPASLLLAVSVRTIRRIEATQPDLDDIYKILRFHRLKTQMFGVGSISLAAILWMYRIYLAFVW